jgi:hypothetical protein
MTPRLSRAPSYRNIPEAHDRNHMHDPTAEPSIILPRKRAPATLAERPHAPGSGAAALHATHQTGPPPVRPRWSPRGAVPPAARPKLGTPDAYASPGFWTPPRRPCSRRLARLEPTPRRPLSPGDDPSAVRPLRDDGPRQGRHRRACAVAKSRPLQTGRSSATELACVGQVQGHSRQ